MEDRATYQREKERGGGAGAKEKRKGEKLRIRAVNASCLKLLTTANYFR